MIIWYVCYQDIKKGIYKLKKYSNFAQNSIKSHAGTPAKVVFSLKGLLKPEINPLKQSYGKYYYLCSKFCLKKVFLIISKFIRVCAMVNFIGSSFHLVIVSATHLINSFPK